MAAMARLVTFVDVDDHVGDARQMSVSARHEAELVDGRRLLLLDDRGWRASAGEVPDIWAVTSVEDIEGAARVVVGPDEAFAGRSQEDMDADHWAYPTEVLRQQGVVVDALELKRLPHDVVLSERLLARIGRDPGEPRPLLTLLRRRMRANRSTSPSVLAGPDRGHRIIVSAADREAAEAGMAVILRDEPEWLGLLEIMRVDFGGADVRAKRA